MTTQQALQIAVVVVVLAALTFSLLYVRRSPAQWPYAIPPVTWLLHILVFYAFVFARDLGVPLRIDFTFWSVLIRLQAAFLILGVMIMLAYEKLLFRT
ncbi:MAG TPA: hypothetical protein VI729_05185 [Anaerolineales bacterium]|nr:hypothetical protein [Anaerolineales bacterium]